MKTIKFIGFGEDYANVMTEEGESIVKLRFEKDAYKCQVSDDIHRLCLYIEGKTEPVAVFAERFYICCDDGSYQERRSNLRGIDGILSYTTKREVSSTLERINGTLWEILVEYK